MSTTPESRPPVVVYKSDLIDDCLSFAMVHQWQNGKAEGLACHSRNNVLDNRFDQLIGRDVILIKPHFNIDSIVYIARRAKSVLIFTSIEATISSLETRVLREKLPIVVYGGPGIHIPTLLWKTLFPQTDVPVGVEMIEESFDRTRRQSNSIFLRTFLSHTPFQMDHYLDILTSDIEDLTRYFRDGKMIRDARDYIVKNNVMVTAREVNMRAGKREIKVFISSTLPALSAETADNLAKIYGIGAAYYDSKDYRHFFVVSHRGDIATAIKLAEEHNGRGDQCQANFIVPRHHPLGQI